MPKGSVKIMLSYDYCHFEIALASDEEMTLEQIDEMRKDAQRLADKAVLQYRFAKFIANKRLHSTSEKAQYARECEAIEKKPEGERTINEVAQLKAYQDNTWQTQFEYPYDYEDDMQDELDWQV